jgi:hypothetical protein
MQDEEDQLREARLKCGETYSHHKPKIAYNQRNRNHRTYSERQMNGNMIHQVRQQKVKREECRCEKEILHLMILQLRATSCHTKHGSGNMDAAVAIGWKAQQKNGNLHSGSGVRMRA